MDGNRLQLKLGRLRRLVDSSQGNETDARSSLKERIRDFTASFKNREYSKDDCKTFIHETADVSEILEKSGIGKKKYSIATSGYSFDQEGYSEVTSSFLKHLDKYLGSKNTGYITPPTLYPGSIYEMTTSVSGLNPSNVALFTTQRYWEGTDLSAFNKDVNMRKFLRTPVHLFPDNQTYLEATANASNVLVCTGGRKVAINEIVEALKRNNKVIMLVNKNLTNEDFDQSNNAVECAPRYFHNYIVGRDDDPANVRDLDLKFLRENQGKVMQLVKWYFVDDEESIKSAAYRAAKVIQDPNIFEMIDNIFKNDKDKDRVLNDFNTSVGPAYVRSKSTRI